MNGKIIRQKWITREDVRNNPDRIYVFGDNMIRKGMGGQAGAMRGEPNSYGVPTKHEPAMMAMSFFRDDQVDEISQVFQGCFVYLLKQIELGKDVVIPADGLGTGLSELPTRAPRINRILEKWIEIVEAVASEVVHV